MIETLIILLGLFVLIAIDLLTVGIRSAYNQANPARLLGMREDMELAVNRTLSYLPLPLRLKASIRLILVLTRFCGAGFLLILTSFIFPAASYLVMAAVLLFGGMLLFGFEWGIDRLVSCNPEMWSVRVNFFIRYFLGPLSLIFIPLGVKGQVESSGEPVYQVTEDDLMSLVDAGEEEGVFEQEERRMIYSIFQLGDTLVREIMVPRIDILTLDVNTTLLDAVDSFISSGHSRVPVHEETVDNTLGLLYAKDLLKVWREGKKLETLKDLLRPAYFVPEAKKVDELLVELQNQRIHMAVVVDEYGGIAGLVTLEDIVEEIFGEIQDEYDQGEESPYQITTEGDYLFQGRIDLDDFNQIMDCQLPTDEADTLGGYIYSQLGHVPAVGESVENENLLLTVEQVSARRIRKVRALSLQKDQIEARNENRVNG
jgi:CBS domain containing-hemolysin-like protein